ncbi:MAG: hypothetical protein QY315_04620 [Saprospiraceae bacterium]|nr:MAG: hypothetical protein QY315_04620 [Saprospiraceae bacterium]
MAVRKCKLCKKPFEGRTDKIFCGQSCKAVYHQKLKKATNLVADPIDTILHRNRSTLLEIMGKSASQKKVPRILLDAKKFNWKYITAYHINSRQKMVHYVYDFSWMIFSDQEILIRRLHPS